MRAVCTADGRWNPDPATLVCTGECSHNVYVHATTMCTCIQNNYVHVW